MKTFDTEPLNLTKDQILGVVHEVRRYYMKSPIMNAKRLIALSGFEAGLMLTSKSDLESIWRAMIMFIDELRYYNAKNNSTGLGMDQLSSIKKSISKELFKEV